MNYRIRWPGRSPLERKTILKLRLERKAQSARLRAQGSERKAQSARRRAQGAERKAQSARLRAQGARRKAQGAERSAQGAEHKAQSARRRAQGTLWDGIGFRYVTVHSRDLLASYSP